MTLWSRKKQNSINVLVFEKSLFTSWWCTIPLGNDIYIRLFILWL